MDHLPLLPLHIAILRHGMSVGLMRTLVILLQRTEEINQVLQSRIVDSDVIKNSKGCGRISDFSIVLTLDAH